MKWLNSIIFGDKAKPLAQDDQGRAITSGGKVEKKVAFNALAITDTTPKIESTGYLYDREIITKVVVRSTLNKPVKVMVPLNNTITVRSLDGEAQWITVPGSDSGGDFYITKEDLPYLADPIGEEIKIVIKCDEAPTSGSVTVTVYRRLAT